MANSVKLGKLFGIRIGLHYSWFIIFAFLAYSLAVDFFPANYPNLPKTAFWIIGGISSLLLFASVLFHELSHSLIAKMNKIKVEDITLFFFGGVAHISEDQFDAKTELKVALAGPIFSLCFGLLFYAISFMTSYVYLDAIAGFLFRINFMLAAFNIIPGYPLDGGRVLRSLIWWRTKDLQKATKYASAGGQGFAVFLIVIGLLNMFGGYLVNGLWFILIGAFLMFAAKTSYEQVIVKEILKGKKIGGIMQTKFMSIGPKVSIEKAVKDYFLKYEQGSFPVVDKGKIVGILNLAAVERVPRHLWKKVNAFQASFSAKAARLVSPNEDAFRVLSSMDIKTRPVVFVAKGKKIIGIVDTSVLSHYLKVEMELDKVPS